MARYINADALMKKLNEDPIGQTIVQRYNIDGFIEAFPTADVVDKARYDRLLENATIMSEALNKYQTADVVEVVRCKDCKWFNDFGCAIRIVDDSDKPKDNDFCSFGERKEGGAE